MASYGTVGDSFLDDLDDLGDSEEDDNVREKNNVSQQKSAKQSSSMDLQRDLESDDDKDDDDDSDPEYEENDEESTNAELKKAEAQKIELESLLNKLRDKGIEGVISLRKTSKFQQNMKLISDALENPDSNTTVVILEQDHEYNLILTSNKMIQDISEEIDDIHRCVAEIYAKKFPELESLISNKLDYIRTIQRIGNEMDMTLIELNVSFYF